MRIAVFAATVLALLLSVQGGGVRSEEEVRLTGEFHWNQMNHTGELDAVFTKMDDGLWGIEFRFVWEGALLVYRGTAEGSLTDGELRGTVVTEILDRSRTFYFSGEFERGRFTGTHTALRINGGTHPTGTLTLGR